MRIGPSLCDGLRLSKTPKHSRKSNPSEALAIAGKYTRLPEACSATCTGRFVASQSATSSRSASIYATPNFIVSIGTLIYLAMNERYRERRFDDANLREIACWRPHPHEFGTIPLGSTRPIRIGILRGLVCKDENHVPRENLVWLDRASDHE